MAAGNHQPPFGPGRRPASPTAASGPRIPDADFRERAIRAGTKVEKAGPLSGAGFPRPLAKASLRRAGGPAGILFILPPDVCPWDGNLRPPKAKTWNRIPASPLRHASGKTHLVLVWPAPPDSTRKKTRHHRTDKARSSPGQCLKGRQSFLGRRPPQWRCRPGQIRPQGLAGNQSFGPWWGTRSKPALAQGRETCRPPSFGAWSKRGRGAPPLRASSTRTGWPAPFAKVEGSHRAPSPVRQAHPPISIYPGGAEPSARRPSSRRPRRPYNPALPEERRPRQGPCFQEGPAPSFILCPLALLSRLGPAA